MSRITTTIVALIMAASAQSASAGYHCPEHLARDIYRQANQLKHETVDCFRYTPQFRHLIDDANDIRRRAARVWRYARIGNAHHLHNELVRLENLLHHFQQVVNSAKPYSGHSHHGNHIHGNYYGHTGHHGFDVRPVDLIICDMLQTIKRTHEEEVHLHQPHHPAPPLPVVKVRRYPSIDIGHAGVSFNGRGFSFRFGR